MRLRYRLAGRVPRIIPFLWLILLVGAGVAVPPAAAQSAENIVAPHYDVRLEILPDGSLDVVEHITLQVGAKPMRWFEREIPRRRTDGIVNVSASLDGAAVPGATIDNGRSGVRIRLDFDPVANTTREIELRYRALHVLAPELEGPRLVWTALPASHTYPIDEARVSLFVPRGVSAERVSAQGGDLVPAGADAGVVFGGTAPRRKDTLTVDIRFTPNTIRPDPPAWSILADEQRKMLPAWIAGALTLAVTGIGILVMIFARLPRRGRAETAAAPAGVAEADDQPPAVAALLLHKGRPGTWLPMQAAFFRLVRDGAIVIQKDGTGRKGPFHVRLGRDVSRGAPHEAWILDGVRAAGDGVDLRRLVRQLGRKQGGFARELTRDAIARELVDSERLQTRNGLRVTGLVLMFLAFAGAVSLALAVPALGPAPMLLAAALLVVAFVYLLTSAGMNVLSARGRQEAAAWTARAAELKSVVKRGVEGHSVADFERWFPAAIGAGIGGKWLKAFAPRLEREGASLAWLNAMGNPDQAAASLAAIIAVSGASHAGASGAGGAGAAGAGGGASGAG